MKLTRTSRRTRVPVLKWTEFDWRPSGPPEDPNARLLATMQVVGPTGHILDLHVEAWAVRVNSNPDSYSYREQVADSWDDSLRDIYSGVGAEGGWETLTISGREYVIIISPFCN